VIDAVVPLACRDEVRHYLETGEHDDAMFESWPGSDFFSRAKAGHTALREALVGEVLRRTPGAAVPEQLRGLNITAFARERVDPMVRGLFPAAEQEVVREALARDVVFITPSNVATVIREARWESTAWDIANLYLAGCHAELMGPDAPLLAGLSEETTSYVSMGYFESDDPYADFVVHEAAHVFHNCKRRTIGLPERRRREWLLEIDFGHRETFAYACEAYSRLRLAGRAADRRARLAEHAAGHLPPVDATEYLDILREAIEARNGWKRILTRCAPARSETPASRRRARP
jgi:hypothetical protein